MDYITAYTPLKTKKKFIKKENCKPAENGYIPESDKMFSAGEWYSENIQGYEKNWREDFLTLIDEIITRFKAGEWNGNHKAEIAEVLADIEEHDQPQLIRALAIDAFLANATDEEIILFNKCARYKHNDAEPKGEALLQRGFFKPSTAEDNSLGIFTADLLEREGL